MEKRQLGDIGMAEVSFEEYGGDHQPPVVGRVTFGPHPTDIPRLDVHVGRPGCQLHIIEGDVRIDAVRAVDLLRRFVDAFDNRSHQWSTGEWLQLVREADEVLGGKQ